MELADRMRKRDPATAPRVGDRVAYVIVQGAKKAKIYEKSEDPLYVLQNDLAIDYEHYIEHHLKNPLLRLFEPILQDPNREIFAGEHTRKVYKPKINTAKGAFGGFIKVKQTCIGCS